MSGANTKEAITKEAVFKAADALQGEGTTVTVKNVRNKLGKRGSFSTITGLVREWKQKNKQPEVQKKEELPEPIIDLASKWWLAALEIATESLEGERQLLEQQRMEMEQELQEAGLFADEQLSEVEKLQDLLQDSQTQLAVERLAHADTRNKLQVTTGELIEYRTSHEGIKERMEEFKERANRYEAQHQKSEEEVKKALRRDAEQENKISRLEGQLEKMEAEMKHQVEKLVDELEKERAKSAEISKRADADQAAAQAAQIELAKLQGEMAASSKHHDNSKNQEV